MGKTTVVNNGRNIITYDNETGFVVAVDSAPGKFKPRTEEERARMRAAIQSNRGVTLSPYTQPIITPKTVSENMV
jgi:hypothetical protein